MTTVKKSVELRASSSTNNTFKLSTTTKRNLGTSAINFLRSEIFRTSVEVIDATRWWGNFVDAIENCLNEHQKSLMPLHQEKSLRLNDLTNISLQQKELFLNSLLHTMHSDKMINSSSFHDISHHTIEVFFDNIYTFLTEVIVAFNLHQKKGQYGVVTHDEGMAMWSTRAAIK